MSQKPSSPNSSEEKYDFLKSQFINFLQGKSIELSEFFDKEINQAIEKNQRIKDSLQQRDRIFNLSLDLFCIAGLDGYFKYLNPAWEKVLGWSSDELMSKPLKEFIHPDDLDNSDNAVSTLLNGNEVLRFENRYICKDGSFRWLSWDAQPFLDEDIIVGTARDVTESKKVESELLVAKNKAEENEKQFRQLFENMEQGFALHEMIYDDINTPVDYRFLLVNKAFEKLTNTRAEDYIGKTVKQILPNTEQVWIDNYGKVAQTGEQMQFEHYAQEFDKYYDVVAYSPKKDFFATVFTDNTERREWVAEINQYVQHLENLNNSLIDVVFTINPKNRKIRYVNKAVETIFGFTVDECIDSETSILYADKNDFKEFGKKLNETIVENRDFLKAEMQLKRKNGKEFTAEITTSFIKNSGEIIEMLSIVRDVSEKINYQNQLVKAKEKAEESEKRFELFVNQSPSPLAVADKKLDNILYWSQSATQKLGHSPKTVSEWYSVAYPDSTYREKVIKKWNKKLKKAAKSQKATNTGEYLVTCKDGSIIIAEFYVQLLPDQIIITLNDITERKIAEEALKQSEENLKSIIENGTNMFYRHDVNHQLKYISPQIKKILGYEVEEAMVSWTDLATDNPINELGYEYTMKAIETGERQDVYDLELRHKNGSKILVEVREAPIVKNGKTIEIVGALADVTEKRKTEHALVEAKEKAEESDRLKTAFLANMSHEIRTPMNGILGFTNLLKEPNLSAKNQKMYIDIIQKSGDRMLSTVNDIIEISKIEAGEITVSLSKFDLCSKIKSLHEFFAVEAIDKGLTLEIDDTNYKEEIIVESDDLKVDSVMTNLIKNAIKYTLKGSIKIGLAVKDNHAVFHCSDTGIGIPEEKLESIFNRFEQADIDDRHAFQGSGLGLSIAKHYAELLNGKLWVESQVNKGSNFYFSIPIDSMTKNLDLENRIEESQNENSSNDNKLKALIVEDDENSQLFLTIILKEITNNVLVADNGKEAITICENNPDINLILMDVRMVGMDGIETAKVIRKFNKEVVIIGQSAYAFEEDKNRAIEEGFNDYLSKPVDKQKLKNLIKEYFR